MHAQVDLGNSKRPAKPAVTPDLPRMGGAERPKNQTNVSNTCPRTQSVASNSNTPTNVSTTSVTPDLSSGCRTAHRRATKARKPNGRVGRACRCAEYCEQFEKACKHVRHGQKTPKRSEESDSPSVSPKSCIAKP